jgi:hypothetical protein
MAIDIAALAAYTIAHNQRATFEGRIAELERICRRDLPPPGEIAVAESRAWYAKEILDTIGVVRHWLAQGQADIAAGETLVVGMLAARAGARHHWPEVQKWTAKLDVLRTASKAGAATNRQQAAQRATPLRTDVETCRLKHPEWSVNRIAQALLQAHGRQSGDRKNDLAALAKRICRLD